MTSQVDATVQESLHEQVVETPVFRLYVVAPQPRPFESSVDEPTHITLASIVYAATSKSQAIRFLKTLHDAGAKPHVCYSITVNSFETEPTFYGLW